MAYYTVCCMCNRALQNILCLGPLKALIRPRLPTIQQTTWVLYIDKLQSYNDIQYTNLILVGN